MQSKSQPWVAVLSILTALLAVKVRPEGTLRTSFWPVARILTLVPPTSTTRIFSDLAGTADLVCDRWGISVRPCTLTSLISCVSSLSHALKRFVDPSIDAKTFGEEPL